MASDPTQGGLVDLIPLTRFQFHSILIAIAAVQVILVWFTMGGFGVTWDEAVYYDSSRNAVTWLGEWIGGEIDGPEDTDRLWEHNWEFLAVPRFVHGISSWLFENRWPTTRYLLAPIVSLRMLNAVAHGLSCWLVGYLLLSAAGSFGALCGALAYATMPRIFGHAHFAMTETLIVTMTLLMTLAFIRGIHSWKWAIATGVVFGLALNTKFNFLFLPVPLLTWAWWEHRARFANNAMAMIFIGPVVWFLTWPWIWTDTVPKMLDYFSHFLIHNPIGLWWHGRLWNTQGLETAPWNYPFDIISATTPIPTLLLSAIGLPMCLWRGGPDGHARLFALIGVVPLILFSLPGTPCYDGIRLFTPILVTMALLAGIATGRIGSRLFIGSDISRPPWARAAFLIGTLALVTVPGIWGIVRIHPYELSYYNTAVGGLRGAQFAGYEMAYMCDVINEPVIAHLNETLPEGASIHPLAMRHGCLRQMQRWGILREDIVIQYPPFRTPDYVIIQNRRASFWPLEDFLWERWQPEDRTVFGWPHGSSEPTVPLVLVESAGPALIEAIENAGDGGGSGPH